MESPSASDRKAMLAEIDSTAAAVASIYDALPYHAQAKAVSLANQLANLRNRIKDPTWTLTKKPIRRE